MGKSYTVPEEVMGEIVKIINSLPYGQVAPLANALGTIMADQQEGKELDGERA